MADNADVVEPLNPEYDDTVEALARKLLHGGEDNSHGVTDLESARKAARRILEDSEARKVEAWNLDPEDDNVIRRDSEETAHNPPENPPTG